jgi:hypothetical protein
LKIWNISVIPFNSRGFITGYMFESETITGAIKQGEKFGEVVKVVLNELDEE